MISALAIDIILAAAVFAVVVGVIVWSIRTAPRPATSQPVAHSPEVREHAVRARAAHATRVRAARNYRSLEGLQT